MALTRIEWAASAGGTRPGYTHNHWVGCTKVSDACDHCYAEGWAKRSGQAGLWQGDRRLTTEANRRSPFRWDAAACAAGHRSRVFSSSLSDILDPKVPIAWRIDLFRTVMATPNLDWLLLTKRPGNGPRMLRAMYRATEAQVHTTITGDTADPRRRPVAGDTALAAWLARWTAGEPPQNVWFGVTVEDRRQARIRLPWLARIPAALRFISAEPLLEDWSDLVPMAARLGVRWLICGGESGPGARGMPAAWATSMMAACQASGIAFFMKQTGSNRACWPTSKGAGSTMSDWPPALRVRQFPDA